MHTLHLGLFLAIFLTACTSVVPSTALKVAQLDPLSANPADIAVAITLPSGLGTRPGSAALHLVANGPSETIDEKFILAQTSLQQNRYLFALKPQDHTRLRDVQAQILAQKALGKTPGRFGVTIDPCIIGDGPADDARGSFDVRLQAGGPLLPLVTNARLDKLVSPETLRASPPCKGAK